ncbi:class II fructose-bisphosphate aldolase [Candidatus Acetothermia bacterium]|nr:MAG: class II fructose-bisphosphate aldolase [Candidatus Acetothermia bacterium]
MPYLGGCELKRVYQRAQEEGFALVANNFAEPNVLIGLLTAYSEARSDLLLQISLGAAKFAGGGKPLAGLRALVGYVRALSAEVGIGVFVNLDHITPDHIDDFIVPALKEGLCSSVMIDASALPFEENVAATRKVVELARPYGVLVEGELGKIKGVEDEIASDEAFYTDPEEAAEFVEGTGVDLLAVSVGTQHGVSKGRDLVLRVDLAREIDVRLRSAGFRVPLVLHGASGLSGDQVRALVEAGIRKVNKDTTYQYVYAQTACTFYLENRTAILPPEGTDFDPITFESPPGWSPNKKLFDPRAMGRKVQGAIAQVAREMLRQAGSEGRSLYA